MRHPPTLEECWEISIATEVTFYPQTSEHISPWSFDVFLLISLEHQYRDHIIFFFVSSTFTIFFQQHLSEKSFKKLEPSHS